MEEITEIYCRDWDKESVRLTVVTEPKSGCLYVRAEAGAFRGEGCIYMTGEEIGRRTAEIEGMRRTLQGRCRIEDAESEEYFLCFSFVRGELEAEGRIGNFVNSLTFRFRTDQTALGRMLSVLHKLGRRNPAEGAPVGFQEIAPNG